jgi:hypothetical protein
MLSETGNEFFNTIFMRLALKGVNKKTSRHQSVFHYASGKSPILIKLPQESN